MRITRPDTTSMILTAACVVGIVLLALFHVAIPDVLTYVAMGALGIGGGTALNGATSSTADTAATRIAEALTSLEQLIGGARRAPAPARPSSPAPGIPAQAGPAAGAAAGSTPVGAP